jgi:SAM-dependent methyltransferase
MGRLVSLARKVRWSLARRGLTATIRAAAAVAAFRVRRLSPAGLRARWAQARASAAWDAALGVDTDGIIPPEALDVAATGTPLGTRYQPIGVNFDPAGVLRAAGVAPSGTTFIDLGSGKGRALLMAAMLPFARIVGVEYSPELHAIADRNRAAAPGEDRIELRCLDARAYEFPPGPLVIFLYNPFGPVILGPVIANLRRSLEEDPRPVAIIYVTPEHADLWDAAGFARVAAGNDWIVWRGGREMGKLES